MPVRTQDASGELAAAFNQMSTDLARANPAGKHGEYGEHGEHGEHMTAA